MGNNYVLTLIVVAATAGSILSMMPSHRDTAAISGKSLSAAVNQTELDRFPGEGELMKAINSEPFRSMIHLYEIRDTLVDPYGLQSANAPRFYGQHDLLRMLQESGIDLYKISEQELEYLSSMDPRVASVLRRLREWDERIEER